MSTSVVSTRPCKMGEPAFQRCCESRSHGNASPVAHADGVSCGPQRPSADEPARAREPVPECDLDAVSLFVRR